MDNFNNDSFDTYQYAFEDLLFSEQLNHFQDMLDKQTKKSILKIIDEKIKENKDEERDI